MKYVQPVRDKEKIQEMTEFLKEKNDRDMIMWLTGIYTGLRISDILTLRVRHVRNTNYISIVEQKTRNTKKNSQTKRILIVPKLRRALDIYIEGKGDNEYLFKSREGRNKPITRVRAYEILKEAAYELGLKEVGTHTMRKTFGYHIYQREKDVAMLQDIFNHSSPYITLKYIGVNQDAIDKTMKSIDY